MIAVLFEATAHPEYKQDYYDIAAELLPEVQAIDGFISIERFESTLTPGKILSLSFWRDEESIREWRRHAGHRNAQEEGRSRIFRTYRLRVAQIVRDYGKDEGA